MLYSNSAYYITCDLNYYLELKNHIYFDMGLKCQNLRHLNPQYPYQDHESQ